MSVPKLNKKITVRKMSSPTSSYTRALMAAGRAASAAAIRQAAEKGIPIYYAKDGVIVKCDPKTLIKK